MGKVGVGFLCLCGCLTAQAEKVDCGTNLQYEIVNDTLYLTSPDKNVEARMEVDGGFSYWAYDSTTIQAVVMPTNLTYISVNAFLSHTALTEVTIPESVSDIASYAFKNCAKLKKVRCQPQTPPTLGDAVFVGCTAEGFEICITHKDSYALYVNDDNWEDNPITTCSDTPTDIEIVESSSLQAGEKGRLSIENNELLILRNNEKYTIDGKKL